MAGILALKMQIPGLTRRTRKDRIPEPAETRLAVSPVVPETL